VKKSLALLILLVSLISMPTSTPAASPKVVTWGTLSVGSGNYTQSVALAEVIKKHSNLNVKVSPTLGARVWVPIMEKKEFDFACQGLPDAEIAYYGKLVWEKPNKFLRLVGVGTSLYQSMVTTKNSGIRKLADLRGKKLSAWTPGVVWHQTFTLASLKGAGLSKTDLDLREFATIAEAQKDITDGKVDAVCWAMAPWYQELNVTKGAYVIPYTEAEIDAVRQVLPSFTAGTSPAGLYEMPATPMPVSYSGVYARIDVNEDLVYAATKAIYDNYDEVKAFGPQLIEFNLANAFRGMLIPFHPGAIKYFKEKGVWTKTLDAKQADLLSK